MVTSVVMIDADTASVVSDPSWLERLIGRRQRCGIACRVDGLGGGHTWHWDGSGREVPVHVATKIEVAAAWRRLRALGDNEN